MGYLVLKVPIGERVVVTLPGGDRMYVLISCTTPTKVHLALDAPPDVGINRDSVQQRIDNGESFATTGHDGPSDTDGPHEAAAKDGHVFHIPREGEQ